MRAVVLLLLLACPLAAIEPLTPEQERKTFQMLPGYRAELVAVEPNVVDPVAMAFDEKGRLFVCEMIGYSNGGRGTGIQTEGRIRLLTDKDGDGLYETATVYADKLRFPTGVLPWKKGLLVAVAPDIVYLEDTDGDGKADSTCVLYTGFGVDNIQQMVNSLQWSADGWVYGVAGSNGGTITSPEKPAMPPVTLRGRGIRFKPDIPGSLEPTSGGGQYGLTSDLAQHWFVNTNSQHLRQIVLPDHYLKRNPNLIVPAVVSDIPEHGAACKLFRVSPFEAWRVERTTRRKDGPEAKQLPPNELVPGGFVTSGCSPLYYDDPLFPEDVRKTVLFCDPANNLVSRDRLQQNGSLYKATRADEGKEFLASTDNWFRPVSLTTGPDGAIYVLDFYREVIETPLSLPDDIKAKVELQSRGRGRIWRIVPENAKPLAKITLDPAKPETLVEGLTDGRAWVRNTASRLLFETKPKEAGKLLVAKLPGATPSATVALLWAIAMTGELTPAQVGAVLAHPDPAVREHALRLSERFPPAEIDVPAIVLMVGDKDPFVRLQLAFTAGGLPAEVTADILTALATSGKIDSWMQTAILSSASHCGPELVAKLMTALRTDVTLPLVARLLAMVGSTSDTKKIADVFKLISRLGPADQLVLLDGLGQGMRNTAQPLNTLWANPPAELKKPLAGLREAFTKRANDATDEKLPLPTRLAAVRFLGVGPFDVAKEPLAKLLTPQNPGELQSAAVQALNTFAEPEVATIILAGWEAHGPTLRREILETLTARKDRLPVLLNAIEKKNILPVHLDASRVALLRDHADPAIRERARKLLVDTGNADRKKVIDQYQTSLTLKGDAGRGREIFRKNCTACHRLENTGHEVGANLTAALRNKTRETLILDILDPSREVDTRFVNYKVTTTAGRTITGILAVETPTSVTLRRGENTEDTVLRSQIDEIRATTKSLMPEEFEKQITPAQLADLFEYLLGPGRDSPGK
ncbi:PVC-type heme-binding CxxCH protein [Zavarzinella formosa]|uniref:PVC-type heme-binding CxxCH protein n=1 Tax=Zavarzinella formosa TaxID=360055 RepID=UPI000303C475|nr:PVC-type heme-binding CxxCH protein [Zavarzinella formosa]